MTQQYRLASMAARLSSTGISHHSLLPHISSICLSPVNSSPYPGIAPECLNSCSLPLCLPGDLCPCIYDHGKNCLILSPFRLPQISCFPLSLKCFSSDSDNCPGVGMGPLLQFRHPPRAGPVLLTLPFFPPSSFILLSFAWVYMFFSSAQVLLSALSWYSTCTSVSEGIFLMYLWRQMYSASTYSSTIVFLLFYSFLSNIRYVSLEVEREESMNPEVGLLNYIVFLIFGGTSRTFSTRATLSLISTNSIPGFVFLQIIANTCYLFTLTNPK